MVLVPNICASDANIMVHSSFILFSKNAIIRLMVKSKIEVTIFHGSFIWSMQNYCGSMNKYLRNLRTFFPFLYFKRKMNRGDSFSSPLCMISSLAIILSVPATLHGRYFTKVFSQYKCEKNCCSWYEIV